MARKSKMQALIERTQRSVQENRRRARVEIEAYRENAQRESAQRAMEEYRTQAWRKCYLQLADTAHQYRKWVGMRGVSTRLLGPMLERLESFAALRRAS